LASPSLLGRLATKANGTRERNKNRDRTLRVSNAALRCDIDDSREFSVAVRTRLTSGFSFRQRLNHRPPRTTRISSRRSLNRLRQCRTGRIPPRSEQV